PRLAADGLGVAKAGARDLPVARVALDSEEAAALRERGGAGAAAARERVEHDPASGAGEPDEPGHQRERLDGRVDVPPRPLAALAVNPHRLRRQRLATGLALRPGGLRTVEEPARPRRWAGAVEQPHRAAAWTGVAGAVDRVGEREVP